MHRSAGACPPRFLNLRGKRSQPRDHEWLLSRPTRGEGQALALREGEVLFVTVARGPVPRDLPRAPVTVVRERLLPNGSRSGDLDLQAWRANDGEGQALALR